MFRYGRTHYSEGIYRNFDGNELDLFFKMYKHKFWGSVDYDTFLMNNQNALKDEGEITAKYTDTNGRELIIHRIANCTYTIFITPSELEDGVLDKIKDEINAAEQRQRELEERMNQLRTESRPRRRQIQIAEVQSSPTFNEMYANSWYMDIRTSRSVEGGEE